MSITGLVETVTEDSFIRAFDRMGRGDNFSINGRRALFEAYEQLAEDLGEPIMLDVIAICCGWSEYDTMHDFIDDCVDPETIEEWKEEGKEFDDWESLTEWLHEVGCDNHVINVETYTRNKTRSDGTQAWGNVQTGIIWGDY